MINIEDSLVGPDPGIIATFVKDLFRTFDEYGLTWAVMRGWEKLPCWTRYDIDILVSKADECRAVKLTCESAKRTGWNVYGILNLGMMHSVWMLRNHSGIQSYLRIDIETGNAYRGIEIHESQRYLARRLQERINGIEIWHMPVGYSAACVLLKELAVSGLIDSEKRRAQVVAGAFDGQFSQIVYDALSSADLASHVVQASRDGDWSAIARCGSFVKRQLFRKSPGRILKMMCYVGSYVRQMLFPYMRLFVVIVGPDGCGKTTIADAIEKRFKGRPFQGVLRIHMRFGVPRMRSVAATLCRIMGKPIRQQEEPAPGTRHMGMQPPHSLLRAMLYVTYYGFGSIFGRLKLMLWRKQGGLVVADRFFQDYYYMRGYMKCPKLYVRIMEFLTPKPDMIVILNRPAEDIYAQKPELTIEEIKREQNTISQWLASRRNAVVIDASKGIEQTESGVIGRIEDWLTKKSIKASAQSV